ncbi:monooxygenase asqM [Podospora australis]|uniref:Monooxygenase asqM n=1 Tax=Podospora australis TaxID=1536484 RepID=A0AAN6WQI8_9PEZI|nr:monooxygenase asqM [Podospora australis]
MPITNTEPPLKIAIIGAGPAGCTLARLLLLSGSIPPTSLRVYESEPSPSYRSQGGTLDLHTSTGLAVLKEAGLFDEFLSYARYDGDFLQITDHKLKVFFTHGKGSSSIPDSIEGRSGLDDQRPEIDRAALRKLLTESIPAGIITWGAHLKGISEQENQEQHAPGVTYSLHFSNLPTESGFTLVIGADGAWSKVRSTLLAPEVTPTFAGIGVFDLSIPNAATTAPEISALIKRGNLFAHREGIRVVLQQLGDGSIGVYVLHRTDSPDWASFEKAGYDTSDLEQVKHHLLKPGGILGPENGWAPLLREAIEKCDGEHHSARTLFQLPVGFKWGHTRGAALIGDAAHLMTPYAGEGVNVALEDAMRLARGIVDAVRGTGESGIGLADVLDNAVREYEGEMWKRAEKVARLTDELTRLWMFTPNTPGSVLAKTTALHVRFHTPAVMHPIATAGVYAMVWYKKLMDR